MKMVRWYVGPRRGVVSQSTTNPGNNIPENPASLVSVLQEGGVRNKPNSYARLHILELELPALAKKRDIYDKVIQLILSWFTWFPWGKIWFQSFALCKKSEILQLFPGKNLFY